MRRRWVAGLVFCLSFLLATPAAAQYAGAPWVHVGLGKEITSTGLYVLAEAPDGKVEPTTGDGRKIPGFLYLDIDDTFMYSGRNRATITFQYLDEGTDPIYVIYDSVSGEKQVEVVRRTDTKQFKSASMRLIDGRFANGLGGADFKIGGGNLTLSSVTVGYYVATGMQVFIDGEEVFFPDQDPVIVNGQTLVPFRALFEAVGADLQVELPKITASARGVTVVLTIGSEQATVNGKEVTLDVPAQVTNGRTLVPLRFIGESLKMRVVTATPQLVELVSN